MAKDPKSQEEYKPTRTERFLEGFVGYMLERAIKEHGGTVEQAGQDGPYLVTLDFEKTTKPQKSGSFFGNLRRGFKRYIK